MKDEAVQVRATVVKSGALRTALYGERDNGALYNKPEFLWVALERGGPSGPEIDAQLIVNCRARSVMSWPVGTELLPPEVLRRMAVGVSLLIGDDPDREWALWIVDALRRAADEGDAS